MALRDTLMPGSRFVIDRFRDIPQIESHRSVIGSMVRPHLPLLARTFQARIKL